MNNNKKWRDIPIPSTIQDKKKYQPNRETHQSTSRGSSERVTRVREQRTCEKLLVVKEDTWREEAAVLKWMAGWVT